MKTTLLIFLALFIHFNGFGQIISHQATAVKETFFPLAESDRTTRHGEIMNRDAGDIIVEDDFSDPSNWNLIAFDGDPNWEIVTVEPEEISDYIGEMESTTEANGFAMFNGIQYLLDGTVTTQDAVLEYAHTIDCSEIEHVTLSFEQRYHALYTDQTFIEVSNNGGVSYDFSYEINSQLFLSELVQEKHYLNITEAAAEQEFVKIRFRWLEESGDIEFGSGYGWMVDDFSLLESLDYDQKITEVFHKSWLGSYKPNGMEYYKISENQIQEIYFSAIVVNQGASIQENLKLNVEITGAETFNTISEVFDLPINSTDSIGAIDSFTPSSVGVYNIKYWFDSDHIEDVTFNDTIFDKFEVTTGPDAGGMYARHSNHIFTDISNILSNFSSPFLIGNIMEVNVDTKFKEFEIDITGHSSNYGQNIFVQVMRYNEITDKFEYLGQTDDHTITGEELGGTVTFYAEDLICVEANDIILLLAGHYGTGGGGGATDVHFRQSQKVDFGTVLGYTSGAIEPFALVNPRAIMIRAKARDSYDCDGSINEIIQDNHISIAQNIPNPFNASTTIAYELVKNADVNFTITDLSGKVIETLNLGNQAAGQHELELNANNYSEGVYFYIFNVGEEKVTKRMIVIK